jgi:predicted transcriptional regulator
MSNKIRRLSDRDIDSAFGYPEDYLNDCVNDLIRCGLIESSTDENGNEVFFITTKGFTALRGENN